MVAAAKSKQVKPAAKSAARKPAQRKPTAKPAPKQPARKPATAKPAAKPAAKSAAAKPRTSKSPKSQKRRSNNSVRQSQFLNTGIGIGPARVKRILQEHGLNVAEGLARAAVNEAAKNNRDLSTITDRAIVETMELASSFHKQQQHDNYEKKVISLMNEQRKVAYAAHRKAQAAKSDTVDVTALNKSFDPNFYDDFVDFCNGTSTLCTDVDKAFVKKSEHQQMIAMLNKSCTRMSLDSRNILAAFLDTVIQQYARNGIYNCVADGKSIIQLKHCLSVGSYFTKNVTLSRFVQSFDCYRDAMKWLDDCEVAKEKAKSTGKLNMPEYPQPTHNYEEFNTYISDLCRNESMELSRNAKSAKSSKVDSEALAEKYSTVSFSKGFKLFCSYLVNEAIVRVGRILYQSVEFSSVKTVSDSLMWHAISVVFATCGIDGKSLVKEIRAHLEKFHKYRTNRKEERQSHPEKPAPTTTTSRSSSKDASPEDLDQADEDAEDDDGLEEGATEDEDEDDDDAAE